MTHNKKLQLLKHKKEIERSIRVFKFNRKMYFISIIIYGLASIFIKFEAPMVLFIGTSIIYGLLLFLNEINLADFQYALTVMQEWEKENDTKID